MTDNYLQLRKITFSGPSKEASVVFAAGVNVICGASDTGKSFLAESIDFMLGGSSLKEIPERQSYGEMALEMTDNSGEHWLLQRATSGGDFHLKTLGTDQSEPVVLKRTHAHDRTDTLSGFLIDKIGLLGKRILKSSSKGTTQSLSFRNLARLIIVQEGEIQQSRSPFWGGQFISKTSEIATVKLLLTGVDDSDVVSAVTPLEPDNSKQIALIDEWLADLQTEIEDSVSEEELSEQLGRIAASVDAQQLALKVVQRQLDERLTARREAFNQRNNIEGRIEEISELLARFSLLREHYQVDTERLTAIQESGSLFEHLEPVSCPLCGAPAREQHIDDACEGDVESIIIAASAEIIKIDRLGRELAETVSELESEAAELANQLRVTRDQYDKLDEEIRETVTPQVGDARSAYSTLIEERSEVKKALTLFDRVKRLEERKQAFIEDEEEPGSKQSIAAGIPESAAHALSLKVASILKAWNFPGECHVHYDKQASDFVIDGKPRASRGKGLRAISHAAVNIALLEYCQEFSLPHPGFVVLDSPLLAYFKPEGDEDLALQGSDLKERFYEYLIQHHGQESQVIVVENQHPPLSVEGRLSKTVFTGNPSEGRFGLL
jgi:AAA domain-containing protein